MKTCGTYDDVNLILRLYDLRREEKLRKAREWFAKSFHAGSLEELDRLCPLGSETNANFRMVVSYWEMTASFVTGGILHEQLFFQSGRELLFVWERLRDVLPLYRERAKDPASFENLETVAISFIAWWNAKSPGAYEAFSRRVRASQ